MKNTNKIAIILGLGFVLTNTYLLFNVDALFNKLLIVLNLFVLMAATGQLYFKNIRDDKN